MNYNLYQMKCLDIYLSESSNKGLENLSPIILENNTSLQTPLLCWDIYSDRYHKHIKETIRNRDINAFKYLAKKLHWRNDIDDIFEKHSFEGLVVTDSAQKIIWVNNGFTEMTGYPKNFAINKTPGFLQGKLTSEETKANIKHKISEHKPFKEVIVNYRKNNTVYKCEINVFPLYTDTTTHFLALEREVS